jgi:hypothetical protein
MRIPPAAAVLIGFFALITPGFPQTAETAGRQQAIAVRVDAGAIRIDGQLTEEEWGRAVPVVDFVQAEPAEGEPPTERMDVRFIYEPDALIVGARMYSLDPARIQAPMSRRDEGFNQAEHIFVSLDTYLDRRTAYTFGVTAAGVRFDHYHATDNRQRSDPGFNPVWDANVSVDGQGWVAELRIPFHQLRFPAGDRQVFGLNIYRAVPSRNEQVYWSPIRRTDRVWASQFGDLTGFSGMIPSRRLELLPYVSGSSTLSGDVDQRDPFNDGSDVQGRTGVDLKVGLGPNVTLDATVNPDFGQVEADPAEVNLSAFETFFTERRPFFLEGGQLLGAAEAGNSWESDDGDVQYFYSRRIGARPIGSLQADFVDHPATSTILGAGKITGRLASGTSVGMLGAVTTEESAQSFTVATGSFGRGRVAPRTTYGVGRIQQEFGAAGSTAAFMATTTHRDMPADDPLAAIAARNALTASGESLLRFREGEYEIGMNLGVSHVAGDAPAIAALQRTSARYLQRPDAGYLRYDAARTSLTGVKGGVSAERTAGRHWLWQVNADVISPEFEINDLGRLNTADNIAGWATLEYRETQPGRLFRNYAIALEHEREWNFGRQQLANSIGSDAEVTFHNFWSSEFSVEFMQATQDPRLTRGGPTMGTPGGWSASAMVRNSSAARTRGNVRLEYEENEDGGFAFGLSADLTLRPAVRWELSFGPAYEREVEDQQFVAALDGGHALTFGRRYVFAFVDRSTLSSEIRLNYAFKPDINLEFYGEPFAASGRYYDFGELIAAGSRERRAYDGPTLRNRDFNVLSFRSNVVLRWEWKPGSTLYVVWQQDREESETRPDRVGARDLFGSFGASGNNVFAVKTTFWLGGL